MKKQPLFIIWKMRIYASIRSTKLTTPQLHTNIMVTISPDMLTYHPRDFEIFSRSYSK